MNIMKNHSRAEKPSKYFAIFPLILFVVMFLISSCGGGLKFQSGEISAELPKGWKFLNENEISSIFEHSIHEAAGSADLGKDRIFIAADRDKEAFVMARKYMRGEDYRRWKEYLINAATGGKADNTLEAEKSSGEISDREIAALKPYIEGRTPDSEEERRLDQELALQDMLYNYRQLLGIDPETVKYSDLEINGQKTQAAEYGYVNRNGELLREKAAFYMDEKGKDIFLLAWTYDGTRYDSQLENFNKIFSGIKID